MTTPHPPRTRRRTLARADGLHVWDTEGRRYLDATSGAFCMQLGYTRPDLTAALAEASARLPHARSSLFDSEPAERYKRDLLEAAGPPFSRVLLASSGSDAVEIAIKAAWWWQRARGAPERSAILSLSGHYHGATLGALAATGWGERRAAFAPWLGERVFGPAAHCARCFRGLRHPSCGLACAGAALESGATAAAFLAESIPSAGLAAAIPPSGWTRAVRAGCDQTGALWIADEVLTGFGRSGALFAWQRLAERDDVAAGNGAEAARAVPDLVVFGKGASAGFYPVAGVLVSERVAAALESGETPFRHAQTFGESPVGAAVALRALEAYREEGIFERARRMEVEAGRVLGRLRDCESVLEVRGMGLLWGIELASDGPDRPPFPRDRGIARAVEAGCRERGVLVHPCSGFTPAGTGDAILVAPPLTTEPEQLEIVASALREAIETAAPGVDRGTRVEEWKDR